MRAARRSYPLGELNAVLRDSPINVYPESVGGFWSAKKGAHFPLGHETRSARQHGIWYFRSSCVVRTVRCYVHERRGGRATHVVASSDA